MTNATIVIFHSDHGVSEEVRAHNGGGSAGPHRGAKFSLYEGGIRVPAIISWPGKLPENEARGQIATGCDWYPTLMELCEVPTAGHRIDGKSLLPVIESREAPTAHESFNWKMGSAVAIREGRWKLIVTGKMIELYDLPNDLGESKNLSNEHPEIVVRLQKTSREYWQSIIQVK